MGAGAQDRRAERARAEGRASGASEASPGAVEDLLIVVVVPHMFHVKHVSREPG